jgi:hypothetical protein
MDRIVVASHITPCGRSWVDNVLLALHVKWSYTEQFDDWVHIWDYDGERQTHRYRHRGKPQGFVRKYCPAMLAEDSFRFRDHLEAISTHSLPRPEWRNCKKIYVVRDFKDVLVSAYNKRSIAGDGFATFIAQLDPDLMLPLYLGLQYHAESWLRQERLLLVRREDYRRDPARQIERLCDFLGLEVTAGMRARVIELAGIYTPQPTVVAPEWRDDIAMVEARCRSTLLKLGYAGAAPRGARPAADYPDPRGFVRLAKSCGVHADVEVWDGGEPDEDSGAEAAEPSAAASANSANSAAARAARAFADINAFLAPLTGAVLNLRLGSGWRAVYGQPVGPARVRGNMGDAMRLVDNVDLLVRRMAADLRAGPAQAASNQPAAAVNALRDARHLAQPGWHTEGLATTIADSGAAPFERHTRAATSATAARRIIGQLVPLPQGRGRHSFNVAARAGTLKHLMLQCTAGPAWCCACFDLPQARAYRRTATPGVRLLHAAAQALDDGWVRCEIGFQFDGAVDALLCRLYLMQDCGVLDFDGAAGDHLFLCDARLEAEPAPAAPRRDAGGAP